MASTPTLIRAFIPLPKVTRQTVPGSQNSVYDLASLQIGECFLLPAEVDEEGNVVAFDIKKGKSKLQSAVSAYRTRSGDKSTEFAVRSFTDENGQVQIGVWRVEPKAVVEAPAEVAAEAPAAE